MSLITPTPRMSIFFHFSSKHQLLDPHPHPTPTPNYYFFVIFQNILTLALFRVCCLLCVVCLKCYMLYVTCYMLYNILYYIILYYIVCCCFVIVLLTFVVCCCLFNTITLPHPTPTPSLFYYPPIIIYRRSCT